MRKWWIHDGVNCDYCGEKSDLVSGEVIYPHRSDLKSLNFYSCISCFAYVGCHKTGDGKKPLGRLANKELRRAKSYVHRVFDPIWKSKKMTRGQSYRWLAKEMNLDIDLCHIGMFSLEQCREAYKIIINSEIK